MLRGFAAIAMIFGHSVIVHPIDISSVQPFHTLDAIVYMFHMEMFFFLAGAVWHYKGYGLLALSKIKRLLIPYGFFGIITLIFHAVGGEAVHNQLGILDGIKKMFFYGGNYWFLYTMFIICLIFPFISYFEKKIKYFDLIVAGGGIADSAICKHSFNFHHCIGRPLLAVFHFRKQMQKVSI